MYKDQNVITINKNKSDVYIGRVMKKGRAIALFQREGESLGVNITFSSKNKTTNVYWANPSFDMLQFDWSLILNESLTSTLYLFKIPANSIRYYELTSRSDQEDLMDLRIKYNDNTFTDTISEYSFYKFLVKKIKY